MEMAKYKRLNNVKLDINFLDKPLYFLNMRYEGKILVWEDIEGFIYRTSYTPPDYLDMLFLLYFLRKSQESDYRKELRLTRYEILKNCGLAKSKRSYDRIKESLERWSAVYLKFEGTFYDGRSYLPKFFHILKGSIDPDSKQVEVILDSDWLVKIKESSYFKFVNFDYYKELRRPVSRRLYEILCKSFKCRKHWPISLVKLGTKLTLSKREKRYASGVKMVLFASDVLVAIKPAIREINQLATTPDILSKTGLPKEDLFTISYSITNAGQKRVIIFHRHEVKLLENHPLERESFPVEIPEFQLESDEKDLTIFHEALFWLDTISRFSKKRKDEITNLPPNEITEYYPGIKQRYEEMSKAGEKPKPGWVYKAFMEKWDFPDKTQPDFPDTPKGKWCKSAKNLYESWSEEEQKKFWSELRDFIGPCIQDKEFEELRETARIWGFWAPKFMEILNLIDSEPGQVI